MRVLITPSPVRPRSRGARRSCRTFPERVSLRPPLGFDLDTPRRLATPTDAVQLHPYVASAWNAPKVAMEAINALYQVMFDEEKATLAAAAAAGTQAALASPELRTSYADALLIAEEDALTIRACEWLEDAAALFVSRGEIDAAAFARRRCPLASGVSESFLNTIRYAMSSNLITR